MAAAALPGALPDQHARPAGRARAALGRRATLDDIPDAELDALARAGFDWSGSSASGRPARRRARSRASNPEWLAEYRRALPDFRDEDVVGSPFRRPRLPRPRRLRRRRGARAPARAAARARPAADARLRPEPRGARPSVGRRAPRVLHRGHRGAAGARSRRTTARSDDRGDADPRLRPRSLFRRLAGHAAAQLRQPGAAGGDAR